jgi:hypothetical protein
MAHKAGSGFRVRLALTTMSSGLLVVILARHDWIKILFRVDPDHGSGWLEWLIVVLAFALTLTFLISARQERRRSLHRPPTTAGLCLSGFGDKRW